MRFGNFRRLGLDLLPGLAGGDICRMIAPVRCACSGILQRGTNRITVVPLAVWTQIQPARYRICFHRHSELRRTTSAFAKGSEADSTRRASLCIWRSS